MNGKCQVLETGLNTAAAPKNMMQPPLIKGKEGSYITIPISSVNFSTLGLRISSLLSFMAGGRCKWCKLLG